MPESTDDDAERTSWLLVDRVDYLEQVATHLLETNKIILEYLSEVLNTIKVMSNEGSEE